MTDRTDPANPIEELRAALFEGEAAAPPSSLAGQILASALRERPAGRPTDGPAPITAVEGFRRSVDALDAVLASLEPAEWAAPALRGLDIQGLVGHLIGVELDFEAALGDPSGAQATADHVGATDPIAHAQAGRAPAETLRDWREAVLRTMGALDRLSQATPSEAAVGLHGVRLPLPALLVVRTFELWTHEEDIRRATARTLAAPDAASLALMTDLAFKLLPVAMGRLPAPAWEGVARVVLTGPGGRTWQSAPLEGEPRPQADVRIVMEAVEFCRLVANRVDPARVPATVTGDADGAHDVFAAAAALALD